MKYDGICDDKLYSVYLKGLLIYTALLLFESQEHRIHLLFWYRRFLLFLNIVFDIDTADSKAMTK